MFNRLVLSLTIICAPFYVFRSQIPVPFLNFNIPTTLLEFLFFLSFVVIFADFSKNGWKWKKLRTDLDLYILFFMLNAFFMVFMSPDLVGALGIFKAYFLEPVIFFYLIIYENRKKKSNFAVYSLIVSGVLLCVLSFLQKTTGMFIFAPHEQLQDRISAVYNSANSLALYLGPISLVTIATFVLSKGKLKFIFLIAFLLNLIVLLWTKSRGGFIAEIISLFIFFYGFLAVVVKNRFFGSRIDLKKFWMILPISIILLSSIFLFQVYKFYSDVPEQLVSNEVKGDTLYIRFLIWRSTLNLLNDSPIFGSGLNGFGKTYEETYKPSAFPEDFQYPHNLILTLWVETGLVGLAIFIAMLVKIYQISLIQIVSGKDAVLGLALISAISYYLIHGVVDVPYFKNDLSIQFWTIVAMIIVWKGRTKVCN